MDEDKKGYVYTYNNAISTDDYPKGQYLDGYALLASLSSVITGTTNSVSNATGESGYSHGLAVRLADLGNYVWHTSDNGVTDEDNTYFPNYISYRNDDGYSWQHSNNLMSESVGGYAKTNYRQSTSYPAFYQCWQRTEALPTASGATDHWFLPTIRQWAIVYDVAGIKLGKAFRLSSYYSYTNSWCSWTGNTNNANDVIKHFDSMFTKVGGNALNEHGNYYWSSSESQYYANAWYYYVWAITKYASSSNHTFYIHGGHNKTNSIYVRPFYAF